MKKPAKKTPLTKRIAKVKKQSAALVTRPAKTPAMIKKAKPAKKTVDAAETKPAVKRSKKVPATTNTEQAAIEQAALDAPRIESRLLIGDLAVLVDAASLDHTLGVGTWGRYDSRPPGLGPGLIDTWPDAVWVALLVHLGLPADPLDRTVASVPVKRLVEQLWYKAVKGSTPEGWQDKASKRDAAAAKEYAEEFVNVKDAVETRSSTARTNFAKAREAGTVRTSTLAGKKIKVLNTKHGAREGSKRAIGLDIILKSKTTDEASAQLAKAGCNNTFITFAITQGFIEFV